MSDLVAWMSGIFDGAKPSAARQLSTSCGSAKVAVRCPLIASISSRRDARHRDRGADAAPHALGVGRGHAPAHPVAAAVHVSRRAPRRRSGRRAPAPTRGSRAARRPRRQPARSPRRSRSSAATPSRARRCACGRAPSWRRSPPRRTSSAPRTRPRACASRAPRGCDETPRRPPRCPWCTRSSWWSPGCRARGGPRRARCCRCTCSARPSCCRGGRPCPRRCRGTSFSRDRVHAAEPGADDRAAVPVDLVGVGGGRAQARVGPRVDRGDRRVDHVRVHGEQLVLGEVRDASARRRPRGCRPPGRRSRVSRSCG